MTGAGSRIPFGGRNRLEAGGVGGSVRDGLEAGPQDALIAKLHLLTEKVEMTHDLLHALLHTYVIVALDLRKQSLFD